MSFSSARQKRIATQYGIGSGGTATDITVSGVSYKLHTFTSDGNFVVSTGGWFDLLMLGGGGAGGRSYGTGGGAGGLFQQTVYLAPGTQTVTIGAGGTGKSALDNGNANIGNNGRGTSVGSFVADGGGAGVGGLSISGLNGGCGGGGMYQDGFGWIGGRGTVGQGFNGGNGSAGGTTSDTGGGGGGTSAVGTNGTTTSAGSGGAGTDISLWLGQSAGTTIKGGGGGSAAN